MTGIPGFSEKAGSSAVPTDERQLANWLESQPESDQKQITYERLLNFVHNASQPRHASSNACLKLCYFVKQCRKLRSPPVQEAICSLNAFELLFEFYLQWNEKNQNRAMRQILEINASLLSLRSPQEKREVLGRLLGIITRRAPQFLVKSALKSLDCFLFKGSVSVEELLMVYQNQHTLPSRMAKPLAVEVWELLISETFTWMNLSDVAPAAGKLLVTIFSSINEISADGQTKSSFRTNLWQQGITRGLEKFPEALENVKNYLLPPLFKTDRSGSLAFLQDLNDHLSTSCKDLGASVSKSLLTLAALEVGKKSGLVDEPASHLQIMEDSAQFISIHEDAAGSLIAHQSGSVRSLAFSVLVSSSSSIRPFSSKALDILRSHMWILYADTGAKFRGYILSTTKSLIERLRGATSYLAKACRDFNRSSGVNSEPSWLEADTTDEIKDLLKTHICFVQWFIQFLSDEMVATASYQRHITALKATVLIVRSGILRNGPEVHSSKHVGYATVWPYTIDFFSSCLQRLLLDLVLDPFEDVRNTAAWILRFSRASTSPARVSYGREVDSEVLGQLVPTLARARAIFERTGRADSADGVAHLHELQYYLTENVAKRLTLIEELVDSLESKVSFAETDLTVAVHEAPLHGIFAALNFVWCIVNESDNFSDPSPEVNQDSQRRFQILQIRIILSCYRTWDAVRDILCNDSPEGNLPEEVDEMVDRDTENVLSYSFRAIHESSKVIRSLIGELNQRSQEKGLTVPSNIFQKAADLSFEQLATLRHRGAFSTVSLTFAKLCQLAQKKEEGAPKMSSLLQGYLENAFTCLYQQPSTTRRSAGLPMLMIGIMSAIPGTPEFKAVMEKLKMMAKESVSISTTDKTHYPQVHALNCLRQTFLSSVIGPYVEDDIGECLEIAASCQASEVWPVRNSGLLLLRSLADRLLGNTEKNSSVEIGWDGESVVIPYEDYPGLPSLLLKLLTTDVSGTSMLGLPESHLIEAVFPALDIIRRTGPPPGFVDEIKQAVFRHLGNELWNVREMAARTASALLAKETWSRVIMDLNIADAEGSTNRRHGALMTLNFVLERRIIRDMKGAVQDLLPNFEQLGTLFPRDEACPFLLYVEIELQNTVAKSILIRANTVYNQNEELDEESVNEKLFPSSVLEELINSAKATTQVNMAQENATALLNNGLFRRAIYATGLKGDTTSTSSILNVALDLNIDMALAALEAIAIAYGTRSVEETFDDLAAAYLEAIEVSTSAEVRAAALSGLSGILEKRLNCFSDSISRATNLQDVSPAQWLVSDTSHNISRIGTLLLNGNRTPSLMKTQILASGPLLLHALARFFYLSDKLEHSLEQRVEEWGRLMWDAGDIDNDFDTRYSAAQATKGFFDKSFLGNLAIPRDCLLPSMLALYDSLNDDDDEIREIAAQTASSLLKRSVVPLAAQKGLIKYMSREYEGSLPWIWSVIDRISSNSSRVLSAAPVQLSSASVLFNRALKQDDALFVEEKQNLFIDEVREVTQWIAAFEALPPTDQVNVEDEKLPQASLLWYLELYTALSCWTLEGLVELNRLVDEHGEDGPLGWMSKPDVFSMCMRVILCAKALLRRRTESPVTMNQTLGITVMEKISKEIGQLLTRGQANAIHPVLLSAVEDIKSISC